MCSVCELPEFASSRVQHEQSRPNVPIYVNLASEAIDWRICVVIWCVLVYLSRYTSLGAKWCVLVLKYHVAYQIACKAQKRLAKYKFVHVGQQKASTCIFSCENRFMSAQRNFLSISCQFPVNFPSIFRRGVVFWSFRGSTGNVSCQFPVNFPSISCQFPLVLVFGTIAEIRSLWRSKTMILNILADILLFCNFHCCFWMKYEKYI